jgi:hypothetical protein
VYPFVDSEGVFCLDFGTIITSASICRRVPDCGSAATAAAMQWRGAKRPRHRIYGFEHMGNVTHIYFEETEVSSARERERACLMNAALSSRGGTSVDRTGEGMR